MFYIHVRVHIATQLQVPSAFSSCLLCMFLENLPRKLQKCILSMPVLGFVVYIFFG